VRAEGNHGESVTSELSSLSSSFFVSLRVPVFKKKSIKSSGGKKESRIVMTEREREREREREGGRKKEYTSKKRALLC